QTRLNSQGCGEPSYHWCVPGLPSYTNLLPTGSQVLPPSLERWICCPNQPLHCDAYKRLGSTGEPFRWYISQPPKCGPSMSHRWRLPSDVKMNAPLRVPTRTRTPLIPSSLSSLDARWGSISPTCNPDANAYQAQQAVPRPGKEGFFASSREKCV